MWRWSALVIVAACVSNRDGAEVEVEEKVAPPAVAVEDTPRPDHVQPMPPATEVVARPLALDDVLPAGTGWKCVHDRCDRACVYPRPSHAPGPGGRMVTLSRKPPCVDRATAFCAAFTYTRQAPVVRCRTTREACEAERERHGPGATACEER